MLTSDQKSILAARRIEKHIETGDCTPHAGKSGWDSRPNIKAAIEDAAYDYNLPEYKVRDARSINKSNRKRAEAVLSGKIQLKEAMHMASSEIDTRLELIELMELVEVIETVRRKRNRLIKSIHKSGVGLDYLAELANLKVKTIKRIIT